jgi:hypothetical protein
MLDKIIVKEFLKVILGREQEEPTSSHYSSFKKFREKHNTSKKN